MGDGVPQSYPRAAQWYRLSARLGRHTDALFALGEFYFHGRGVGQDYGSAMDWYIKAAERGHPVAQHLVGMMYREGWGVEEDDIEAYKWLSLAEKEIDVVQAFDSRLDPTDARESLIQRMNRSQIDRAKKRAKEWKPQ